MVKDAPLEMEDLTVPNGTTALAVEELTTLASVDVPGPSTERHARDSTTSATTPSNDSNSQDSDSDSGSHHELGIESIRSDPGGPRNKRGSQDSKDGQFFQPRESTFSDTIEKSDSRKPKLRHGYTVNAVNVDAPENDSDDGDGIDSRNRRSVVGPLGGNTLGIMNPRPSRRASFAMQMLMPMHNLQNLQNFGQTNSRGGDGGCSRRSSAAQNQQHIHQHPPESGVRHLREGTRHMSILNAPPPQPRQRTRSSSFALNSTAAISGFQAQLNAQLARDGNEDRGGRKKSLVRSRTSVAGLDSLIQQASQKAMKDDAIIKELLNDDASDHGNQPGPETPLKKDIVKMATFSVDDQHSHSSHHSESDSTEGSDESHDESETHYDDTGEAKKAMPAVGRRFTRLLPVGKDFMQQMSYDGNDPWIFSHQADMIFGCLIVLNAAFIGLETDYASKLPLQIWLTVEILFVTAFTIELILRVKHHKKAPQELDDESGPFWKNSWNIIDFIIVVVGIVDTVIITLFIQEILGHKVDSAGGQLSIVTLIRLLRILRLLRVLRIFRFLRELLLLAQGIFVAIKALIFPMMLVFLVLYTCSIMTTKLIGGEVETGETPDEKVLADWFGSVPQSMFTLFQLMTLEEWSNVARLCGDILGGWCQFFLFGFVMFTNLVLLNLVAGVILENVLAISRREEEKALQKEEAHRMQTVLKIHNLFDTVLGDRDTDELTIEEFRSACCNPRVVRQLQSLQIATYEAEELFILMDTAKRGAINIDHFIEGCLRIRGAARAKHLLAVQFDVQKVWSKLSDQLDEVEDRLVLEVQRNTTDSIEIMQEYIQEMMPDLVKEAVTECLVDGAEDRLVDAVKDAVTDMLKDLTKEESGMVADLMAEKPQVSNTASSSSQAWPSSTSQKADQHHERASPPPQLEEEVHASRESSKEHEAEPEEAFSLSRESSHQRNSERGSLLMRAKSLLMEELHKLEESHEEHLEHEEGHLHSSEQDRQDSDDEAYADPTALSKSESAGLFPAAPSEGTDSCLLGMAEATAIVTNSPAAGTKPDTDPSGASTTARKSRKKSTKEARKSQVASTKLKDVASRMETLHREEDGLLRRLATCRDNRNAEVSLLSRLVGAEEGKDDQSDNLPKRSISFTPKKSELKAWESKPLDLVGKRNTQKGTIESGNAAGGETSTSVAGTRQSTKLPKAAVGTDSKGTDDPEDEEEGDASPRLAASHSGFFGSDRPPRGNRGSIGFTSARGSVGALDMALGDRPVTTGKRNSSKFFGDLGETSQAMARLAPKSNPRSSTKIKSWND